MTNEYAPSEEILKVAEEGIRGMLNCVGGEIVSPDVMIDAALHILAAWVASSQTHSPVGTDPGPSITHPGKTSVAKLVFDREK